MSLSSLSRTIGKFTAALGVLQSLTWICLTFACIIVYNWEQSLPTAPTSYSGFIRTVIYLKYLYQTDSSETGTVIIRHNDFTIFMWIYLILSALWLAFSLDQYNALHYNKNRKGLIMIIWGTLTLIISVLDLIFTSLLARDYSECTYVIDNLEDTLSTFECFLSTGIVMTFAARGYFLWLFNVITSVMVLTAGSQARRHNRRVSDILYRNHTIPRAHVSKNPNSQRSTMPGEYNNSASLPAALHNRDQNIYY